MVRNLMMTNSDAVFPGRRWRKNTEPRDVSLTTAAIRTIQGASTASSTSAPQISNKRFQAELHQGLTVYKGFDWGATAVSPDILFLSETKDVKSHVACHKGGRGASNAHTLLFATKAITGQPGLNRVVEAGILWSEAGL